jgi:DNA polymerase III sliding clamp (beta) subunit (PCNA family)
MIIDRKKFIDMLNATKPALGGVGATYSFRDGYLRTFNDEMYVEAKIPDPVEGDVDELDCTVSSFDLLKLLKSYRTKEVTIEQDEEELFILSNRSTAGLRLLEDDPIPFDIEDIDDWKDVPSMFRSGLEACIATASDDLAKIDLCDLAIREGNIVSTDGYRITRVDIGEMDEFCFPKTSAKEIIKYEVSTYYVGDKWIYFSMKDGTTIIGARLTEDNVPEVDAYFEAFDSDVYFDLPEDINGIVDRLMTVAPKDIDPLAKVTIRKLKTNGGKIEFDLEGNSGWVNEGSMIKFAGENLEFKINPAHLKQKDYTSYECAVSDTLLYIAYNENTERLICLSI